MMDTRTTTGRRKSPAESAACARRRRLWVLLAPILVCGSALVSAQESASYKIKSLSIATVAGDASSSRFVNAATAVTVSGASGVCPGGISATFGFWSSFGGRAVPLFLTVDKGATDLTDVQLDWSGQSSEFAVYRSVSPTDVVSPGHVLATTSRCEETDSTAGAFNLVFYTVEPVVP